MAAGVESPLSGYIKVEGRKVLLIGIADLLLRCCRRDLEDFVWMAVG